VVVNVVVVVDVEGVVVVNVVVVVDVEGVVVDVVEVVFVVIFCLIVEGKEEIKVVVKGELVKDELLKNFEVVSRVVVVGEVVKGKVVVVEELYKRLVFVVALFCVVLECTEVVGRDAVIVVEKEDKTVTKVEYNCGVVEDVIIDVGEVVDCVEVDCVVVVGVIVDCVVVDGVVVDGVEVDCVVVSKKAVDGEEYDNFVVAVKLFVFIELVMFCVVFVCKKEVSGDVVEVVEKEVETVKKFELNCVVFDDELVDCVVVDGVIDD